MKKWLAVGFVWGGGILAGAAQSTAPAAGPAASSAAAAKAQDCSRLKGKARTACDASKAESSAASQAPAAIPPADTPTPNTQAFPEEESKHAGDAPLRPGTRTPKADDMPTGVDADPPAESMQPLRPDGTPDTRAPGGAPSSSSSSGTSAASSSADDEDAAPTTAGSDTPIAPGKLKDLGSHGDTAAARQKLEANRVSDDLKVGRYYFQEGNLAGATARYKDALSVDADNPDAHFGLAEVLLKQNKQDEAAMHLHRYLQLAPDDDHTKAAQKLLAKLGK